MQRRRCGSRVRYSRPCWRSADYLRPHAGGVGSANFQPRRSGMKRLLITLALCLIPGSPALALAGPKEDVGAATQAWIDGMNSHNAERVVALYDAEAVLWGTRSATLRDTPAMVGDYFKILQTVPSSSRSCWASNGFVSTETRRLIPGRIRFPRIATVNRFPARHGS